MQLQLRPDFQRFVDEKIEAGEYASPNEVIEAALSALQQQERCGDFAPGELDRLLAEGEADIERGDLYDGEEVFRELDQLSAGRRKDQSK